MGNSRPYDPYDQTTWYNDDGTPRKNPYKNGKNTTAAKKGNTPTANQREDRGTNRNKGRDVTAADVKKYVTDPGKNFLGVGYIKPKKSGKSGNNNNNNSDNDNKPKPREIYPVSQVQIPLGSGQVITPNLQEAYIREVTRLTLNLISSAENLLFAYNFTGINKIASYMLEADDASQRSTAVVSNIIRPRSGVELSELEVRDKLNNVINLIANTIGDLVTSSTKLNSFGQKKDNLDFIGGTPRIDNRTSFYDLELELPDIQGFGYDVAYTIKCYDIS
jgi:hypothetical protein